jgi:hypothetical protein
MELACLSAIRHSIDGLESPRADASKFSLTPWLQPGGIAMVNIFFRRFNGFALANQKPLKRLKALSVDSTTGLKPRC